MSICSRDAASGSFETIVRRYFTRREHNHDTSGDPNERPHVPPRWLVQDGDIWIRRVLVRSPEGQLEARWDDVLGHAS